MSAVEPETPVRLAEIPGFANLAPYEITVTLQDALWLILDDFAYGTTFLQETGLEAPTHRRLDPTKVRVDA